MDRRSFLRLSGYGVAGAWMNGVVSAVRAENDWPEDLASHRIMKIERWRSNDRYPRSLAPNAKSGPHGHGYGRFFRTVTTNHGAVGFGMSWAEESQIQRFVGAALGDLFDPHVGTIRDADGLDLVLHDLAGVILRKPVYEMMGAKGPRAIEIYSGAIYMEDLMPKDNPRGIQAVLDACRMDYKAGYRAFKLKIGRGHKWMSRTAGDRRDIEVTRAVREQFPDCKILVDANDSYSVDGFLKYVKGVADCELFWIEEPFDEHREGLERLKEQMEKVGCKALIADGEARKDRAKHPWRYGGYSRAFVERILSLAEQGLIDVCVFDLGIVGYTRWRQIMPELKQAGLRVVPHLWGGTPRPFYCAHLGAGLGNMPIIEGIPGVGRNLDYSQFRIVDGKLYVPKTPGFGIRHRPGPGIGPAG